MHGLRYVLLAVVYLVTLAAPSRAQSPGRVSVTLTGGPGTGWTSGDYRGDASAVVMDAVLGARLGRAMRGRVMVGVGVDARVGKVYIMDCLAAPSGGCVPWFPEFSTLGPLVGWESTGGTLRMMAGPTVALPGGGDATLGLQSRLDLAGRLIWRLAGVATVKSQLIPNYRGHAVGLLSAGFGIRVQ